MSSCPQISDESVLFCFFAYSADSHYNGRRYSLLKLFIMIIIYVESAVYELTVDSGCIT